MKSTKTKIIYVLAAVVIFAGCAAEEPAPESDVARVVNVETSTVEAEEFTSYLKLVGTVSARNDVRVSAEVSGRVNQYFVEQGDPVRRGDPILQIDDSELRQEKLRLEAVTAQSRENYERLERLYQEENIGSEIEYLNAKYAYEQNRASLESVSVSLEKTTVRAPFDATLEEILVEEGEMASPGTVLLRLIGSNRLKVSAGVPARYADAVQKNDRAQVWFDSQSRDTLDLPITFVGQSIDTQARTFNVELALPGGSSYKVDMVANVRIQTFRRDSAMVVGKEYIYQQGDDYVVYKAETDGQNNTIARMQPVVVGASYQNDSIIEQGLAEGDRLITVGSAFLQDGMHVRIVNDSEEGIAQSN